MASIVQSPAPLNLQGVAGSPFVLTLGITLKDSNGDTISWSDADEFIPLVEGLPSWSPSMLVEIDSLEPTVDSPEDNIVTLSWSTAQTQALSQVNSGRWAFLMLFEEEGGPYALVGGGISMGSPTTPGSSTSTTQSLIVDIGTMTASLTVTLGGAGGGDGGGMPAWNSVFNSDETYDASVNDFIETLSGVTINLPAAQLGDQIGVLAFGEDGFVTVVDTVNGISWIVNAGSFPAGTVFIQSFDGGDDPEPGGYWFPIQPQFTGDVAPGSSDGDTTIFPATLTVVGIQGFPAANTTPNTNDVMTWNGSAWGPAAGGGGGIGFCAGDPNTLDDGESVNGTAGNLLIENDNGGLIFWLCTTTGGEGTAVWTRMQAADDEGNFYVGDGQNAVSGVYNLVGGEAQNVTGNNNVVGGYENTVEGIMNGAFGTKNNVGEALFCFVAGYGNTIGGDCDSTGVIGDNNSAYADFAFITGGGALAYTAGQKVHSSTNISVIGDAQDSLVTWGVQTIDGTQAAETLLIFSSNGTEMWDRTVGFTITAVARRIDEPGTDSFWECKGVIRGNGADSYSFIDTPTFTVVAQDPGASDWVPGLALSGNILDVQITGEDGASIYWNFVARLNEVAG